MKLDGIFVPVVTPFTDDNQVNFEALGKLLDWQIEAGVAGIVACGTTGEYYAFSDEERTQVLTFIAEHVGDRAQLIAGVNDTHTQGSINKAQQAKALGYQGLMLAPPIYCLPQQSEIITHYQTVSREVGLPIIMYNFPARSGVEIEVDSVIELSRDPNIVGIKESSGDFTRALSLINADLDDFAVVCGSDDQGADYLFWGVRAWIGGAANYLPEAHVQMLESARVGDYNALRAIMAKLLPVIQNQESADYNQKAKLALIHRGQDVGPIRAPLQPISQADQDAFLQLLDAALQ